MGRTLSRRVTEQLRREGQTDIRLLSTQPEDPTALPGNPLPAPQPLAAPRRCLSFWEVVLACLVANVLWMLLSTGLMLASWGLIAAALARAMIPPAPPPFP